MEIEVNGHRLHYELHGPPQGRPVVLLHHGLGSTRAWKLQIPALCEAGFRVLVYDRWGYGASDPRTGLDIPSFTTDILDLAVLLERLGIERPALVGHSDGGTIALYFAAQYPQRVERLVVVAAHIYVEKKMERGIQEVRSSYETDPRFRHGLERIHGEKAGQVFHNWYAGWDEEPNLDWDMRPLLAQVRAAVLVVQGSDDEHASAQHAVDLAAALPQGELWLEAGAAHMLPQEQPEAFNQRICAFLKAGAADQ
jgi:pimeloyl-ACP methyl ester carboxylesterase